MCAQTCRNNYAPRFIYGIKNTERCNSSGCTCFCEFSIRCRVVGHGFFNLYKLGTRNKSCLQKRNELGKISIVCSFQFCEQNMLL